MPEDPKVAAVKKEIEEMLAKMKASKVDTTKLAAVIKEGNSLKGDKDNPV